MKKLYISICGVFMLTINSASATEFMVKVSNIDTKRGGSILVMIFGEKGYPKKHEEALFTKANKVLGETMEFSFELNIEEFAVKVLHDENEDWKVTKNWTGIYPKEGLGFSNGQKIGFTGPPNYKKSKLIRSEFKDGLTISVIYP